MDVEFSTDIEPMQGGHGDLYLRLLGEEARAFKGGGWIADALTDHVTDAREGA